LVLLIIKFNFYNRLLKAIWYTGYENRLNRISYCIVTKYPKINKSIILLCKITKRNLSCKKNESNQTEYKINIEIILKNIRYIYIWLISKKVKLICITAIYIHSWAILDIEFFQSDKEYKIGDDFYNIHGRTISICFNIKI